jgi:xylulokinase
VNLDSSHAAFKAMWVREREPEIFAQAAQLVPPGSYVLSQAAGVLAVDYSNASSLALLDPRSRTWSRPVLEHTGLDERLLPELAPSTQPVGRSTPHSPMPPGCPWTPSWSWGAGTRWRRRSAPGVHTEGEVCDVAGTAEPVCAACAQPSEDPTMLVECHPHADPGGWLLENPGFVSGGSLRWWRDQFGIPEKQAEACGSGDAYDLLTQGAARIPPGSEGLVFLPCLQGAMAPEWNGAARGVFYGLSLAHTRAHLLRALLEGSAFALRDILEAMRGAGLGVQRITIVGGGAKGPLWRQIKADVTGLPVRVPTNVETTAAGAAILAAVGSGECPGIGQAVQSFVTFRPDEHQPDPECYDAYEAAYRLYRDVYFSLKPVFARSQERMAAGR